MNKEYRKRIAVYAGSFDPITKGHEDIIKRALKVFDELHIVVAINSSKKNFFSKDEREHFIKTVFQGEDRLVISAHDGLIIDYARRVKAQVLVRGLRAMSDFDYEFHMSTINQVLCPEFETFFVATSPEFFYINSSVVKELAKYKADVTPFVPKVVADSLSRS